MKKFMAIVLLAVFSVLILASCGDDGFNDSREIDVYVREDGSGTRGAFNELFGIVEDGTDRTTQEADILQTTAGIITSVSGNVHGIGYISLGSVNSEIKALSIDGIGATFDNVLNGSYKVFRPFNVAVSKSSALSEAAQDFMDFILSAQGQAVVADRNYIPLQNASDFTSSQPSGSIMVEGSSSVTPLMERLIEAYAGVNPNATIELQSNSSGVGIASATEGRADIGMVSRALRESELADLNEIAIALDGIAIIVHPDNPITGLTSEQVTNIFIGEATVWNEVR